MQRNENKDVKNEQEIGSVMSNPGPWLVNKNLREMRKKNKKERKSKIIKIGKILKKITKKFRNSKGP